jgi:hypothetical protein
LGFDSLGGFIEDFRDRVEPVVGRAILLLARYAKKAPSDFLGA